MDVLVEGAVKSKPGRVVGVVTGFVVPVKVDTVPTLDPHARFPNVSDMRDCPGWVGVEDGNVKLYEVVSVGLATKFVVFNPLVTPIRRKFVC